MLAFGKARAGVLKSSEQIFLSITLSVMFSGWVGLLLASLGIFSIWALLAIGALWSLAGAYWLSRRGYLWQIPRFGKKAVLGEWLLTILLVGTAILFFLAPHETVAGAQDSGVYYNTGVNIARTGALVIQDPLLQTIGSQSSKLYPVLMMGLPGGAGRFLFVDFQRMNGYFVMDNMEGLTTGKVIPQFFHFYPTLLAIGVSLFGLYGGVLVNPFLALMAVFGLYLTARRILPGKRGEWVALLAALLLALNGIQVWFARETLWETLGEFLAFAAIYAFTILVNPVSLDQAEKGQEDNGLRALGGFVVGSALGILCLAHASQALFTLPLVIPYLIWIRLSRRWNAGHWWLLGAYGLLFIHMVLHIWLFALAYWEGIYHHVIINFTKALPIVIPIAIIGLLVVIFLNAIPKQVQRFEGWLARHWRWVSLGLALIVAAYLIFNYFIRVYRVGTDGKGNPFDYMVNWQSYIGAPTSLGPERNLLRLGWYFSPLGIVLVIIGVTAMLAGKLNWRSAMFFAFTLGVTYFFLDESYTQEGYIYSLRRYVNLTIPAFSLFIAYAALETLPNLTDKAGRLLNRLFGRKVAYMQAAGAESSATIAFAVTQPPTNEVTESKRGASTSNPTEKRTGYKIGLALGLLSAVGLVSFMLYTNRTIYTLSEYGAGPDAPSLLKQMENLADKFGPKDIIIYSGERDADAKSATILTYAFNHPAFLLTAAPPTGDVLSKLIAEWEKQGYTVKAMLGPDGGRLAPQGYNLKWESEVVLHFRQFESLQTQKPYNIQDNTLTYGIYRLTSDANVNDVGTGAPDTAQGWKLEIGKKDFAALVMGFSSLETKKDGAIYRWTTQDGVLRVPCLDPTRPYRLELTLDPDITRPASLSPLNLSVYLSNDPYDWDPGRLEKLSALGVLSLQPGAKTYTLDIPGSVPASQLTCKPGANSLILQLVADKTWKPSSYGLGNDSRSLGVKLLKVAVQSKQ